MVTVGLQDEIEVFFPEAHYDAEKMAALAKAVYDKGFFENYGVPFCMTVEAEAMGAFHTADVPYWINHFSEARADYWTDVDYALGDAMSDYLVNFATTGDPNGTCVPAWTEYGDAGGKFTYMELGDEVSEQTMADDRAAFWKAYLAL